MTPNQVLIDSHVLLWALFEEYKLGPAAQELLATCPVVLVSVATITELTFKHGAGKLPYAPEKLLAGIQQLSFQLLDLRTDHFAAYAGIQLPHRDPFDRLLVAQSYAEGIPFVTADTHIIDSPYTSINVRL